MNRIDLIRQLKEYKPYNEQESNDRDVILKALSKESNIFERTNATHHMTASAWVLNKSRTKVLMIYHNIYNSWSWTGGHADGEENLLEVALREIQEETGVSNVAPLSDEIFSLEVLTVDGHEKKGHYVSSHLHLNLTYLFEADEKEVLRIKPDENSGVAWFTPEEALHKSTEPWFVKRIYSKLNEKLKTIEWSQK